MEDKLIERADWLVEKAREYEMLTGSRISTDNMGYYQPYDLQEGEEADLEFERGCKDYPECGIFNMSVLIVRYCYWSTETGKCRYKEIILDLGKNFNSEARDEIPFFIGVVMKAFYKTFIQK